MNSDYPIYEDGVIAIKLWTENTSERDTISFHLAIRYLEPQDSKAKDGNVSKLTNIMGGETDWFTLPHSFAVAIGKTLIEQKVSGLDYFDEDGFKRMIDWLVELEEVKDCMEY